MQNIEIIKDSDHLLAFIIRADYLPNSTSFLTPHELEIQAGFIVYKKGENIKPHYHLASKRLITRTTECLLVKHGKCIANIYDKNQNIISTNLLNKNDILILIDGGHEFVMLEDTILFEIKQGPYLKFKDKEHF